MDCHLERQITLDSSCTSYIIVNDRKIKVLSVKNETISGKNLLNKNVILLWYNSVETQSHKQENKKKMPGKFKNIYFSSKSNINKIKYTLKKILQYRCQRLKFQNLEVHII